MREFKAKWSARFMGISLERGEDERREASDGTLLRSLAEFDIYGGENDLWLAPDSNIEDMLRARISGDEPKREASVATTPATGRQLPRAASQIERRPGCSKTTP